MAKKNATKLRNPFVYQGYASPDYFCDRIVETEELISNLQNGRNTVLISQRRIGKTGLIKNVFHHLSHTEKDAVCIYVDIMALELLLDKDLVQRTEKGYVVSDYFFDIWLKRLV